LKKSVRVLLYWEITQRSHELSRYPRDLTSYGEVAPTADWPKGAKIADHWAKAQPPVPTVRPSEMDKQTFVAEFGSIFEGGRWIAEGAHSLKLGPTHDCAEGVHRALAQIFRNASEEQRIGVLTAHPDLAGKPTQARRLTADSTAEHASVGLDTLPDAERAEFMHMNAAYTSKFGFPFIIAVRDNTKATIKAAFQRRISNDRATEMAEACRQVERIAELRLHERMCK
jgi:OHCU decarboxylase